MANLTEVFFAQPKQRSTIKLGVAADIVVGVRVQRFPGLVSPFFLGLVFAFDVDRARIPVVLFPANIIAALQDKNAFARGRESVGEGSPSSAGSYDDDVVVFMPGHVFLTFDRNKLPRET